MWEIVFILPNLKLDKPFENDFLAIVPHNDSRILEITKEISFVEKIVNSFIDQFRQKKYPAFLIKSDNCPVEFDVSEAIIGFRNLFAISCLVKAYEHSLNHSFVAFPLFSEYFDFYPITVAIDKKDLVIFSPAVLGVDEPEQFIGQTSPGLPTEYIAQPDEYLANNLVFVWEKAYIKSARRKWKIRALFRSLEMAYHASAMPSKNNSSIYDYGSNISLWVSALEILSHPPKGNANLKTVINLLDKYKWRNGYLNKKQFLYKKKENRVTLVSKLYAELYKARCDFLHGNSVEKSRLFPFKKKNRQPLNHFAPLIYKVALMVVLENFIDKRKVVTTTEIASTFTREWNLKEAILKARKIDENSEY